MRKRIAIGAGLVVVVLAVVVLVCDRMPPTEPSLRVGMTEREVEQVLGRNTLYTDCGCWITCPIEYFTDPDCLGNHQKITVEFRGTADSVSGWQTESLPRTRPPWLDRVMTWAGR